MEIRQEFKDKFRELRKEGRNISFITDELYQMKATAEEIDELILIEFKINGRLWEKK